MSVRPALPAIVMEPKAQANCAIIWLHGLGASGDDFAPMAKHLTLDASIQPRFIFPHAPERAISVNGGMEMPAWYDLTIEGFERKVNVEDLFLSCGQVMDIIEQQIDQGMTSERIILAGFSQGGAVAYDVLFHSPHRLAGIMAMSTYIANPDSIAHAQYAQTPVWLSHGSEDEVVPMALGLRAKAQLKEVGFNPSFSEYRMGHNVCPSQLKDIQGFINRCLA